MKVSLQIANQFSNVDLLKIPVDELLQKIGAQLGAVEEVINWGARYKGIVVVKVMEVKDHPNADKLHVCLIDDGGVVEGVDRQPSGLVQIVCGAPEVAAGMTVVWIPPGSIVPSTYDTEPFTLEVRELRGIPSPGMLGTPHELAISDDHSGLLSFDTVEDGPKQTKPGTPFVELFGLNDVIIDCENKMFTHRPDCFGILGVAREMAGILGQKFVSPDWYQQPKKLPGQAKTQPLSVFNDVSKLCPRFMAVVVDNIQIKPSPLWLQAALTKVGIRPINNIVDITNYAMQLTGQPMHAFDYHKIAEYSDGQPTIGVRLANDGEELTILSGKAIKLTKEDLVVATNKSVADIAGIMGGSHTEIDNNTRAIVLTVASFDMYAIRRSTMRHGVFTDAATRYTKGQSILQNDRVLAYACQQILDIAGGNIASDIFDDPGDLHPLGLLTVDTNFINTRLGAQLLPKQVAELLSNVEFKVDVQDNMLEITVPFWRTDIEYAEDILEEVGRLYGFDKLPVNLPTRSTAPVPKNMNLELSSRLRSILAKAGANEVLTYSFVAGKLIDDVGQNKDEAYQLSNALSPELQYYRLSLTPSLLSKIHQNIKAGYDQLALFELGRTHLKIEGVNDEGLPTENAMLSLVVAADDKSAPTGAAFYQARSYLDYLTDELGLVLDYEPVTDQPHELIKPFEPSRSAVLIDRNTGNYLGIIGEFKALVRQRLKLPVYSAGFEIMTEPLLAYTQTSRGYRTIGRFPGTSQDISLKGRADQQFGPVNLSLERAVTSAGTESGYTTSIKTLDIYHKAKSTTKNLTFRVTVAHPDRTLTTDEVTKFVDRIVKKVTREHKLERI